MSAHHDASSGPAAPVGLDLSHPQLGLALRAATAAADLLVEGVGEHLEVSTKSSRTDVVTQMDTAAEALLVRTILAERPEDGLLGEEGSDRAGTSGVRWIIDPLDGTVNYLYRLPGWAVSVAVEVDGVVEVGVVAAPMLGETYVAVRGQGAALLRPGHPGSVSRVVPNRPAELGQCLVATGFGYARDRRAGQARALAVVLPEVRDIRRAGAAAIDLCWTAAGHVDCYYERGLNPWDLAAGVLVATEAGLVAGGPGAGPASPELTWLAPPDLADAWRALLARAGADHD
ncbi:MAG TPA: inositol monophosphatase family protein [Candidatus Nanopelagicales bacterium]